MFKRIKEAANDVKSVKEKLNEVKLMKEGLTAVSDPVKWVKDKGIEMMISSFSSVLLDFVKDEVKKIMESKTKSISLVKDFPINEKWREKIDTKMLSDLSGILRVSGNAAIVTYGVEIQELKLELVDQNQTLRASLKIGLHNKITDQLNKASQKSQKEAQEANPKTDTEASEKKSKTFL